MRLKFEITLSSYLSLLRIVLSPFVLFFILNNQIIPAIVLFIIAAISDAVDGYVARRTKITKLGSALDPLADKILISLTTIGLVIRFNFPLWALIIFLARDIILVIGAIMVYDAVKKLKATIISKINTWFQVGAIISYVINFRFKNPILLVAVILTIISFLQYALKAFEKEEK